MTSVLQAGWVAAGRPSGTGRRREGHCARCGDAGLVSVVSPVSKTFTAYDEWCTPVGGTCAACGWGYTTAAFRQVAHVITRYPTLTEASRADLCDLLAAPIRVDQAVVVPLRPGRKHLLPVAQWGRITLDDVILDWTGDDAFRLGVVQQLRTWGFPGPSLLSLAPPFAVLRHQPKERWPQILQSWSSLGSWRAAHRYLDLAVMITTSMSTNGTRRQTPAGQTV